jgi:hypothetical protein
MFIMGIWIFFDVFHGFAKNRDTGPEGGRDGRRCGGVAAWECLGDHVAALRSGGWGTMGISGTADGLEITEGASGKVPEKFAFC